MRSVVICDMRDYVKVHWKLILMSAVATFSCFGFLFRDGALSLRANVFPNGILFLLFFLLGANILTFGIYHFSEKKEKYPYWVFLLLYVTSNIWSYQVCFSLQQIEAVLALCLLGVVSILIMRACFFKRGKWRGIWLLVATLLMIPALCVNRALTVYYVAISIGCFFILLERDDIQEKRMLWGGLIWLLQLGVSYLASCGLTLVWHVETVDYMSGQLAWGRQPAAECWQNVLDAVAQIFISNCGENFSFYAVGGILSVTEAILLARSKRKENSIWKGLRYGLLWVAIVLMLLLPLFPSICTGEMLLNKSQFALPVTAAFLGMYGIGMMRELWSAEVDEIRKRSKERMLDVFRLCALIAIVMQVVYNLRGH